VSVGAFIRVCLHERVVLLCASSTKYHKVTEIFHMFKSWS